MSRFVRDFLMFALGLTFGMMVVVRFADFPAAEGQVSETVIVSGDAAVTIEIPVPRLCDDVLMRASFTPDSGSVVTVYCADRQVEYHNGFVSDVAFNRDQWLNPAYDTRIAIVFKDMIAIE